MPCKRTIHGRVVFWPERCNVGSKKLLLDPELTPMENCWKMIRIATLVRLAMFKVYAYEYDDMADLEQMVMLATFNRLKVMVRDKEYDRRYPFYLNVRAACWSICQHVVDRWMCEIRQRYNLVDGTNVVNSDKSTHSHETVFDMVATESVPKLITASEYRNYSLTDWHDAKTEASRTRVLNRLAEDSYEQYCEDCLELGLKPVDKVAFLTKSYTDEERQIMMYSPKPVNEYARKYRERMKSTDPHYKDKQREYNKLYYQKHKEEIKAQRKRNAT